MKFPKLLSKERLSLLSPSDRKIYEYEHSGLYPISSNNTINENNVTEIESVQINEAYIDTCINEIFNDELKELIGEEDFNNLKKGVYDYIKNEPDTKLLNEAEGTYADKWLDCTWIGKLAGGLLGSLLGIIAWAFMNGKDKYAMVKLKQYMNKLVEMTDSGVNKKRPWYSFLMFTKSGKQNTGDYNKACFRTILETAERNMASLYALTLYSLGFLNHAATDFSDVKSGAYPANSSGLNDLNNFMTNFNENPQYADALKGLLPDTFTKELNGFYNEIQLPNVPTNFQMLTCNIDYPTKANENPNGSLFMKPTVEILDDRGSDLGYKYFRNGNLKETDIIHTEKDNETIGESYQYSRNSVLNYLLEVEDPSTHLDKTKGYTSGDFISNADATRGFGKKLDLETLKRQKTEIEDNHNQKVMNPIAAIDEYIKNSLIIVTDLVRTVCNSNENVKKLNTVVNLLVTASNNNLAEWIEKKESVIKEFKESEYNKTKKEKENQIDLLNKIITTLQWIKDGDLVCPPEKLTMFNLLINDVIGDAILDEYLFNDRYIKIFKKDYRTLNTEIRNKKANNNRNESIQYVINKALLEADINISKDTELNTFTEELNKKCERIKTGIKSIIIEKMNDVILDNPDEWLIIKNAQERMKFLKERADEEIKTKIGLICRTSSESLSGIGDKFKSALSKHPIDAAALQNIWARYSDDLVDRYESRLKSITHGHGNSSIYVTIRQFLITTYPNLIALLLYIREIFFLLEKYTKLKPVKVKDIEEMMKENKNVQINDITILLQNLWLSNELKQN